MGVRPEWSNRWNELLLPSRADLRIFREWKKARDIEEAQAAQKEKVDAIEASQSWWKRCKVQAAKVYAANAEANKKAEAEGEKLADIMCDRWEAEGYTPRLLVMYAAFMKERRAAKEKAREVDAGGTRTDTASASTGKLRHAYSTMRVRRSSRRVVPSACPTAAGAPAPSAAPSARLVAPTPSAPSEAIGGEGGRGGVLAECQHVYIACICPITAEIMTDPVSTLDGFTYERAAITEWLRTNDTSPFTGVKLESKMLIPNSTVRCLLQHV